MKKQLTYFFLLSGLSLASPAVLQAQFLQANAQEALGYGVALEQGQSMVLSAADFALANANRSQGLTSGYDFANVETDRSGTRLYEGEIDQNAFHLNYGQPFGELVAALQVSFFDSQADADYRDGTVAGNVEIDADAWFLASTIAYKWERFNFAFLAGFGSLSNDSTRRSVSVPKTGDFDSEFYTLGFNADYTIYEEGSFSVSPRFGLIFSSVEVDAFNESPAPDSGAVDSMERDWFIGSLDIIFDWTVSERFMFQALLGWHYDFNSDETTLSGVDNSNNVGQITIPDVGESYFKGGLRADLAINENWSLGADTSVFSGDDLSGFSVGASLGYRF